MIFSVIWVSLQTHGSEKVFVSKTNIKQIFHSVLVPTFLIFVTFSWGGLFRAMGYTRTIHPGLRLVPSGNFFLDLDRAT
jgi:Na+/proline symporter